MSNQPNTSSADDGNYDGGQEELQQQQDSSNDDHQPDQNYPDDDYNESQQQQEDDSQGWTTVGGGNRPQASPRRVGQCTSFNAKKGWGWLRDIYTDEVFMVHHSEIRPRLEPRLGPSYFTPCLWTGEYVEFSVGMNPRKQQECAKAVTGINGGTLIMDYSVALVTEYRGADGNPVRRQLSQLSSKSSGQRTASYSNADRSDADRSDADQYAEANQRQSTQQRATAPYQRQNNNTRRQQQEPLQTRRR
jgi:hypothetical protein